MIMPLNLELESGLNERGMPVGDEIDARFGICSIVHIEEGAFTFFEVSWETTFQGPFFEVVSLFS